VVPVSAGQADDHSERAAQTKKDPYTIALRLSKPSCPVYWNLDAAGHESSGGPGWTESSRVQARSGQGTVAATVGWRYNVDAHWAMIESRRKATPYWGFIERSCLANPPQRMLSGHAKGPGWHSVTIRPAARPAAGTRKVRSAVTLRDKPSGFVIGNIHAADGVRWTGDFRWTRHCSTKGSWVFGYAPDASSWGWILSSEVGNPCNSRKGTSARSAPAVAGAAAAAHPGRASDPGSDTGAAVLDQAGEGTSGDGSDGGAGTTAPPAPAPPAPAPPAPAPPAPAPPATPAAPSTAGCHPQYTVTSHARARATRAGAAMGDVAPGTHVNARSNDGVWLYGYISQINGGSGGFGWILDEKLSRTGTFCE
jgi:hypothetical protein